MHPIVSVIWSPNSLQQNKNHIFFFFSFVYLTVVITDIQYGAI